MNVQHFRHDPASPNKECDERQASFDPNYGRSLRALNSHIMPLRLVVTGSIFSLQLGFFYPPDNKAHCDKIKIAGDSHQVYEYSFERIERIGTTYLSVGSIPSQIYGVEYVNANTELKRFWSNKITGINTTGSFFDGRTGQILQSGGKAYSGNSYYLLQRCPLYSYHTDIEATEVARNQASPFTTWYLYKIRIKKFSAYSAKFFLKYAIFLTEKPTKFYPIWPAYINDPYFIYHNSPEFYFYLCGDDAELKSYPATANVLGIQDGKLYKLYTREREQLISLGKSGALGFSYLVKQPLRKKAPLPAIIISDHSGNTLNEESYAKLPKLKCISVSCPYDGKAVVQRNGIRGIMGWGDNDPIAAKWSRILREKFMDEGQSSNGKYYIDLSRVKPRFDLEHTWFRCERCSELTPYLLRGKCPSCQCEKIHPMTAEEIDALDFWRAPIDEALRGETIRVIDTEEHTAQLSHKDQRDELWSKTEQYELRFQDFLQDGEAPVDILSSTTTMEVGIDIGSLVAVGLRNIPPMRENYQQRAGRAGRRGSSLSTIVTFCEDGPHDSLYFSNPVPMFRGDPRRPWIDIGSEKIVQRHLGMVALQSYLRTKANSLDAISAIEFLDDHLQPFSGFLTTFKISENDILVPANSQGALYSYKGDLEKSLFALKQKRDNHPELFETDDNSDSGKKTLLDALYEEGIIPTYSFPKNVVSTYISDMGGKVKYQVERGLDVAIGEYAPGRAIVVDKTTYQIGGLYYPGGERSERTAASPARSFINDASYRKTIRTCGQCGWFGLEEDNHEACPFCGNSVLTNMLPMLRPWGFAPRNATSIETAQLNEEYTATQQPLYSTLPDADDVIDVDDCANIRMAVRPNQRIIMLNKGVGGKGFTICCDCGAAMPGGDPVVLKDILRPYRSKFNKTRCRHTDTDNVNLGYDFVTDMLVLEFALDRQLIDINPQRNSWLNRAGQSLAEALRLAACQELDIEFTELVTGYRVRHNQNGDFVDVYLYDSLSSGAGYAVSIESSIQKLLTKTRELLAGCSCDSACHKCLKHYRNQYIHSVLDRKAALDLLNWGETGIRASALPDKNQQYLLQSLEQILQISGVHIDVKHDPVRAEGRYSKKKVVVYPAMWTKPVEENTIFVSDAHLKYAKPYALKTILDNL